MIIVSFIHNGNVKATRHVKLDYTQQNINKVGVMVINGLISRPDHWDSFTTTDSKSSTRVTP